MNGGLRRPRIAWAVTAGFLSLPACRTPAAPPPVDSMQLQPNGGPDGKALSRYIMINSESLVASPLWRERLDQAERLSDDGKAAEALKAAQDALSDAERNLGPENPEVMRILSRLSHYYAAAGDVSRFPEMEKRLSAVQSKDFDIWFALGTLRREAGRSLEAEVALKKALALKADDPDVERELAKVYEDMGRLEEAIPLVKKMIERRPRDFPSYFRLARVYTQLGRFAEAKEAFARARKIDGMTVAEYVKEGYFYLHAGQPEYARESFQSAIAVDTASPSGYHHMAYFLAEHRRYPEAEKYYRRALEMLEADPNAALDDVLHAMIGLGLVVQEEGRADEAEAVYRKGAAKAPPGGMRQMGFYWTLAKLYVSQGKTAQAEEAYKQTAAGCEAGVRNRFCSENAVEVLLDLGRFYLRHGRRAEAEATAERAEKYCENVPIDEGRFERLRAVSIFYAALGAASKNEALCARLLPMRRTMPFNPDLVWVETGLAGGAAAGNRFPEAEDHYRQAIEILEHNRSWREEAAVLDDLAAMYEKERKPGAGEAREKAASLRARP